MINKLYSKADYYFSTGTASYGVILKEKDPIFIGFFNHTIKQVQEENLIGFMINPHPTKEMLDHVNEYLHQRDFFKVLDDTIK